MANGLPNPLLTADAARSLVDSVDAFLFDCDGIRSIIVSSPSLLFLGEISWVFFLGEYLFDCEAVIRVVVSVALQ